jgi:intraflagellar transport protein 74
LFSKQISGSTTKQEALALLEQLHEAELKKMQLVEEAKNAMAPAEERELLLKQVKENNQEIAVIEKQYVLILFK